MLLLILIRLRFFLLGFLVEFCFFLIRGQTDAVGQNIAIYNEFGPIKDVSRQNSIFSDFSKFLQQNHNQQIFRSVAMSGDSPAKKRKLDSEEVALDGMSKDKL